jgi:hypothetical protein
MKLDAACCAVPAIGAAVPATAIVSGNNKARATLGLDMLIML